MINKTSNLRELKIFRKYFSVFALVFLVTVFSIWNPKFFSLMNFRIIAMQSSVLAIAAYGATLVIITGSIDLSVGSIVGLCAVTSAAISASINPAIGILSGILVGLLTGLFNGTVLSKGKIPSFIITLGVLNAGRGLILVITQGRPIIVAGGFQRFLGGSFVFGIPILFILAILFGLLTQYLLTLTPFGRKVFAVGGGEVVSKLSGVNVDFTKIMTFTIAGLYAGFSGVLLAGRMAAGSPTAGQGFELDVITSVILGGTLLTGGVGSAFGTFVGALIIGALSNGMNIVGVNPYVQYIVKGMVLILAVGLTLDRGKSGIIK